MLTVLRILAAESTGLSLTQLSLVTGTPKTSLLALLRGLTDCGYIAQRDAIYVLGQEAYALASSISARMTLPRVARPILEKLAQDSGETVLVAELTQDQKQAVYIDKLEGTRAVRFIANVGEMRPLYASAGGRVLLAFQSPEFQADYLASTPLRPLNRKRRISRSELRRTLDEVRARRLAVTKEDVTEGVAGFAAPIFGPHGRLMVALIVGAPIDRGLRDASFLENLVMTAAVEISRAFGAPAAAPLETNIEVRRQSRARTGKWNAVRA